jgi:hypothetical protein
MPAQVIRLRLSADGSHILDAGYFPLYEKPDEIAKLVGGFLRRSVNQQSSSNDRDGFGIGIGGRS